MFVIFLQLKSSQLSVLTRVELYLILLSSGNCGTIGLLCAKNATVQDPLLQMSPILNAILMLALYEQLFDSYCFMELTFGCIFGLLGG